MFQPTTAISRSTLAQRVAEDVSAALLSGLLKCGQPLPPESELAANYGVSRPVVREALGYLRAFGLVEVVNGKGATITAPGHVPLTRFFNIAAALSDESTVRLLEVRRGIEVEAASLAAQRRTDAEMDRILHHLDSMRRLHRMPPTRFDSESYAEADRAFHLSIAQASHNDLLGQLCYSIREPMKHSILTGLKCQQSTDNRNNIQASHEAIAAAIKAGDPLAAMEVMREHLSGAVARLLEGPPRSATRPSVGPELETL